jgi:hypothetical protein
MDLNIDNYNIDELLNLFNIKEKDSDINTLQENLSKSISIINNEVDNLPEDKDSLIEFYTKAVFKILNNKKNVEDRIKKNDKKEELKSNEEVINSNLVDNNNNIINRELINGGVRQPVPPIYTINTNKNLYSEGLVNPLERETITTLLSINSKFRYTYSKSSSDFSVELNEPYNNVVSIKLASMEMMNSYYAISEYLSSNNFTIEFFLYTNTYDISFDSIFNYKCVVPDGNYNISELVDKINNKCFSDDPSAKQYRLVKLVYHKNKGKVNFVLGDALGNTYKPPNLNVGFNISFRDYDIPKRAIFLNLGWILGYRDPEYYFFEQPIPNPTPCDPDFFSYRYISPCKDGYLPYYQFTSTNILNIGFNPEAIANTIGTNYFLLEVDDFNRNQSVVFRSNTQLKHNIEEIFNYSLSNVLARIPNTAEYFHMIFEDSSDQVFKARKYFGPVRLTKLKIRLLDENGVVVNLNNNDIVINLQIEMLNAPYKNLVYRN